MTTDYRCLPSAPQASVKIEESETSPQAGARQGRTLTYCERCGAAGTTTDPDQDYVCNDCAARGAAESPVALAAATFAAAPEHNLRRPDHLLDGDAWTCAACHQVFWVSVGGIPHSCPRCAQPPALPIETGCTICAGAHRATQCPQVAAVKAGMGLWEDYTEDKAGFLKIVQWAPSKKLFLMATCVAAFLSARWGHRVEASGVLGCWRAS